MRVVQWILVFPPLCFNFWVHCRSNPLHNYIGTSGHVFSTELEGYSEVLWAELSIWAMQCIFEFLGNWSWENLSNKNCPFCQCPIPVQTLNFAKILSRHKKVSVYHSQVTRKEMWLRGKIFVGGESVTMSKRAGDANFTIQGILCHCGIVSYTCTSASKQRKIKVDHFNTTNRSVSDLAVYLRNDLWVLIG
jgi:hypothetical protein